MEIKPELAIVAPVYNESIVMEQFVKDWISQIRSLSILFELRIYDDGSTDNTAEVIQQLQLSFPELRYIRKTNSGHGPTITEAYHQSLDCFWIFQVDSDHELPVSDFEELWKQRLLYDILLGERIQRHAPVFRKLLTGLSYVFVRLLFGKGINDINSPYRLIRSEKLNDFLQQNKNRNFAPNVLMSALAIKRHWKIKTIPIKHNSIKIAKGTGYSPYLLSGAVKTVLELIRLSFH